MNVVAHPLFSVFAFTLFVAIAGVWWLLRERGETPDRKQWTSPLREEERSVMEILQDKAIETTPLAQPRPVSPESVTFDKKDAAQHLVRREEMKTRLSVLDELIRKQRSRIASARSEGLDVTLLEEQLKVLSDSHEEYFSSLKRLLSDFVDGDHLKGGNS